MEDLKTKSFGPLEIKDAEQGEVTARVAQLNVVDKDKDVILPGAVPADGAKVKMSGYAHDIITKREAPVGKGTITEEGDWLVFRGKFFMSTTRGREAFNLVKELGADSEWSIGFPPNVKTAPMTKEWTAKGASRLIAGMNVLETSPVMVGAGIDTQTVGVKEAPDETPEPPPELSPDDIRTYQENQNEWLRR